MGKPYRTTRRVQFRDTDAAGIVHFSVFFVYMEQAEHELFRDAGMTVVHRGEKETISWPRVSATCDYRIPFKFEDEVVIEVRVKKIGSKSLTFGFRFFNGETECAEGEITAVCCIVDEMPPKSILIPDEFRERFSAYLSE